jgi:hypothetical protein
MISVSQAVQSLAAAGQPSSVQLSRTALLAASFQPEPSTVVSLGNSAPGPLLYTAAGLLNSAPAGNAGGTAGTTAASATDAAADTTGTTATATTAIVPATATAAGTATTATAAATPLVPAIGEELTTPLTIALSVDPDMRALADFTANPVHGGMAAALSINAAIYRATQDAYSATPLVDAIELPGPVTSLNAINVDIADLDQRAAENQYELMLAQARSAAQAAQTAQIRY